MERLPRTSKLRRLVPLLVCLPASVALGFLVNVALLHLREPASRRDDVRQADPPVAPATPEAAERPGAEEPRPSIADGGVGGVDLDGLRQTIDLYRRGDLEAGDRTRANLTDPASRTLSEWVAIRYGGFVRSERIFAFMRDNPDWPIGTAIRRRAEEALLVEHKAPAVVRAFFSERKPVSPAGKLALALALRADGFETVAAELVREMWRGSVRARVRGQGPRQVPRCPGPGRPPQPDGNVPLQGELGIGAPRGGERE